MVLAAASLWALCAPAPAPAAGPACIVRGDDVQLYDVIVSPQGAEPFTVELHGASVIATLPSHGVAPAALEVQGAISFKARRQNLWVTVLKEFKTPDGMVTLHLRARLVHARSDGDAVTGAAVLYSPDTMAGELKEPTETVYPVRVPCNLLGLSAASSDSPDPPEHQPLWWWRPARRANRILLRSQPDAGAPVRVLSFGHCEPCFVNLKEIEHRGEWVLLERAPLVSGVAVTGWVPRSELRSIGKTGSDSNAEYCAGAHGGGLTPRQFVDPEKRDRLYEGPVRVRAGAQVFTEPDGKAWGIVNAEAEFRVFYYRGEEWARLTRVPGIRVPAFLAFVRAADVIFP